MRTIFSVMLAAVFVLVGLAMTSNAQTRHRWSINHREARQELFDFFALAGGTRWGGGAFEDQQFKLVGALPALVFVDRHVVLRVSYQKGLRRA